MTGKNFNAYLHVFYFCTKINKLVDNNINKHCRAANIMCPNMKYQSCTYLIDNVLLISCFTYTFTKLYYARLWA